MPCHEGLAYISFCINSAGQLPDAGVSGSQHVADTVIANGSTQACQMVNVPASHNRALHLNARLILNWLLSIAYAFFGMQSMMTS